MIHRVTIQNYKNLRDQTIDLDRLTVFVGANGSGKTSVLEAIDLAVGAEPDGPGSRDRRNQECGWIYTRGGSGALAVTCETEGGRFTFRVSPLEHFLPSPEPLGTPRWKFELTADDGNSAVVVRETARPLAFLRLNAAQLAEASYTEIDPPRLESDGGGLASVLAFMALNDPDAFGALVDQVRQLLPQIKRIRFRKVPVHRSEIESIRIGGDSGERRMSRTFQGEAILLDFKHANDVAAQTASEGTLLILGLLTALLGPTRPRVLLLDDIDRGLHPLAQKDLVAAIGRIMEQFPDLQVLTTAHSPYLLNELSPEQVRIMATDSDGHARCGPLTDHPKFAAWKDEMAPGEMWSLFGERWLANADAGAEAAS